MGETVNPLNPDDQRPEWRDYFLDIARAVSARASCPRAQVGAVLVDDDHRILSTGYNGAPTGTHHCIDVGCLMSDDHCQRALHAEMNAVGNAARIGVIVKGATLYLVGKDACVECKKVLAAAGVYRIEDDSEEREQRRRSLQGIAEMMEPSWWRELDARRGMMEMDDA